MKILNLTTLLIFCCLLFSCISKTEKKQPKIIYNNAQNYKFDDDEIRDTKAKDIKKKQNLINTRLKSKEKNRTK